MDTATAAVPKGKFVVIGVLEVLEGAGNIAADTSRATATGLGGTQSVPNLSNSLLKGRGVLYESLTRCILLDMPPKYLRARPWG